MLKVVHIVGARPQFIKAAALTRQMKKMGRFKEILVHTGQHFDENMSDVFFRELEISKADYNLEVHSLSQGAMTGRMTEKIEKVLMHEKPDVVVVYGDTNSTLAGTLAAAKLHLKLAHVEAGIRSFNMKMQEEVNRIVTDRLSHYLFCPTTVAVRNLEAEGFRSFPCKVILSGDVTFDAALYYASISAGRSDLLKKLKPGEYALGTIHRPENTEDPVRLKSIVHALNRLNKSMHVVLPMHPRTRKALHQQGLRFEGTALDPVGYFDMIELIRQCRLVLTDSGGLQKEAFYFQKHCVTLRDETEWTELVDNGFNKLAGADEEKIFLASEELIRRKSDFNVPFYGDGHASEHIAKALLEYSF